MIIWSVCHVTGGVQSTLWSMCRIPAEEQEQQFAWPFKLQQKGSTVRDIGIAVLIIPCLGLRYAEQISTLRIQFDLKLFKTGQGLLNC